ncbi:MAG: hypothetical protein M3O74_06785 [Pseudomonadota bacterium]|nr:hypothetical protein [Pseudomonadota bacterium]
MFRIDDPSASTTLPTPEAANAEGYWTEGNPAAGTPATLVRASFLNMVQEELRAVVVAAGLTPSKTTYNQVYLAIQTMFKPGRLLRTSVYTIVSGTQMVSVNGATATATGGTAFTPLSATTICDIEVQAGGGGSGGCGATTSSTSSISGGGGAGAYGRGLYLPSAGTVITVGAGGTAAVAGGNGGNGGTSSVGSLMTSPGGFGSNVVGANGGFAILGGTGLSGTSTGANLYGVRGSGGSPAQQVSVNNGIAGQGGASEFGGTAQGPSTVNQVGLPGSNFGTGGTGSFCGSSNASGVVGAAGAPGVVIIREYA